MASATLPIERVQKLFVQKLQERYSLNLLGLKKAFSNFDLNKDGLLDVPEIQKCVTQFLAGISEDSIASLVKLYDTNGDGKISYEEFLEVLRNPKILMELKENALPEPPSIEVDGDVDSMAGGSEVASSVGPPAAPAGAPLGRTSRRARAAAQPVSDRQSSIFSFNDDAMTTVETEIDLKDSHELEKRSRSFLYNMKQLLLKSASDLRHDGKAGSVRERLIVNSSELLDTIARGLLAKAFEPFCGSGGRGETRIELGDFAKALRSFRMDGSSALRPEVIYFIFHLCKRQDDETAADLPLFETLVFGAPPNSPRRAGNAKSPRSPSKMAAAGVTASRSEAEGSWFGNEDDEDASDDPLGMGGLSMVENAVKDHPMVSKGPYKKASRKSNVPIEVPQRFISRRSRTSYPVPSNFEPAMQERSSKPPTHELEQAHMFGLSCTLNSGANILALPSGVADPGNPNGVRNDPDYIDSSVILYAAGSTGVVHDLSTNTQAHFRGHEHEVTCIALSHCGTLVATGCNGASKSVVHVWPSTTETQGNPTSIARLGEGFFDRAVCAVSFCCDPNFVAAIGCDDGHRLGIWDIRSPGTYLVETRCQNGIPPQIKGMKWAPQQQYTEYISTQNRGLCDVLCTVGDHHLKLWSFKRPVVNSLGTQENAVILQRSCILGAMSKQVSTPKVYTCCDFVSNSDGSSDTVVGGSNGVVYLFKKNICSAFKNAIRGGVTCLQVDGDIIAVGGANGVVKVLNSRSLNITMGFTTAPASVPPSVAGQGVSLRPSSRGAVDAVSRGRGGVTGAAEDEPFSTEGPTVKGIVVLTNNRGSKYALATSSSGRSIKIDFSKFSPRPSSAAGKQKAPPSGPSPGVSTIFHYHTAELWGLSVGTVRSRAGHKHSYIATTADDRRLAIWSPARRCLVARTTLPSPSRCCAFDPTCRFIAVGTTDGAVYIYEVKPGEKKTSSRSQRPPSTKGEAMSSATREKQEEAKEIAKKSYLLEACSAGYRKDFKESVSDVKFSPDGTMLAAGSNDDTICIYAVFYPQAEGESLGLRPLHRLKGHSSYISHLDWSEDGTMLRSTCGAYELLFWDAKKGQQYTGSSAELAWHTETCPLGFEVMGIWPAFSDGTDINAVDALTHGKRAESKLVVTGDDDALVNLLNYPCVVRHAPRKTYGGHGAHVTNTRFFLQADGTTGVVSTGGRDASIILWDITMPSPVVSTRRFPNETLF